MIKRCLIGFTVLISCFLFASKASAISSDTYDMSSWIDVSEFTLPNSNVNPDDYYIVIWQRSETLGYRLVYWAKDLDSSIYVTSFNGGGVFPNTTTIAFFYGNDNWKKLSYYDETEAFSKSFKSSSPGTSASFTTQKLIYSNVDIWYLYDNGSSAYKWFDLSKVSFEQNKDPIIDETSKTITIPVNYFYQDGEWQNYYLYFAAPTINNMNYSLKFEYLSRDTNLSELPIELIIHDKIDDVHQHLANISNSKYTSGNGFGGGFSVNAGNFGGGGGGGRLDDDTDTNSCMATSPFTYSGSFANERIYGLVALSLNSCYDLTGKTPDDFNTEAIKITYSARIVDLNTEGELGSDEIGDMLEDIRNEHQLEQDNISFDIFAPVIKLVTDKLPIINQFNQILNQFNYNETFDTPPTFVVDIPYFNLKNVEVFNFQFFDDYRDYVLGLQCLVLAIFTGVKCYRIVSGYFGGGDSE